MKKKNRYILVKNHLFFNPGSLTQVGFYIKVVSQKEGASVVLEYTHQTSKEEGILITNPKYNEAKVSQIVFYSIRDRCKKTNL